MPSAPLHPSRFLVCASAAHCAQVLHAAAAARVNLHGLQLCTQWPTKASAHSVLLWALLPAASRPAEMAQEWQWRAQALHAASPFTIHMLYGHAAQQAAQLAPWVRVDAAPAPSDADCWECLDAASEQQLFQHLLQRT